jgi:hypothetical protein
MEFIRRPYGGQITQKNTLKKQGPAILPGPVYPLTIQTSKHHKVLRLRSQPTRQTPMPPSRIAPGTVTTAGDADVIEILSYRT